MAAKKRTPAQREADLVTIGQMYLLRIPQHEIAESLGLSRQQIGYDLTELFTRWKATAVAHYDEAIGRELARLDIVERNAWAGYERTNGVVQKRTSRPVKGKRRNQTGDGYVVVEVESKDQAGDPKYLAIILRCVELRAKLLGLVDFDLHKGDQDVQLERGGAREHLERLLISEPTGTGPAGGPEPTE